MKYLSLKFDCELTSPGFLSAYKGSMLRGAMGNGLRRICCNMRRTECAGCVLESACPFPRLFLGKPAVGTTIPLPPPYCLVPADHQTTAYARGDTLSFTLRLFSYAVDYLPYFIHALVLAGERGMGKKLEEAQGTFQIRDILVEGRSVYQAGERQLLPVAPEDLLPPIWKPSAAPDMTVCLSLLTPCRFKRENHFSTDLPFSELLLLVLRRIKQLCLLENNTFRLDAFQQCMAAAAGIQIVENGLRWQDWTRWSNRQKEAMQLGGLMGYIRYAGALDSFLPFLLLAQKIHLGKQTSFGLGQIQVSTGAS